MVKNVHTVLDDFFARKEYKDSSVVLVVKNALYNSADFQKKLVRSGGRKRSCGNFRRIVDHRNRICDCVYRNDRAAAEIVAESFCIQRCRTYDYLEFLALCKNTL